MASRSKHIRNAQLVSEEIERQYKESRSANHTSRSKAWTISKKAKDAGKEAKMQALELREILAVHVVPHLIFLINFVLYR